METLRRRDGIAGKNICRIVRPHSDIKLKAISGQHLLSKSFLFAAAITRIEAGGPFEPKDIQQQDVLDAIQNLYKAADAIDSIWDDTKDNKTISKRFDRNRSYKVGKKGETATARYNDDAKYMSEGAAEAAYPGRLEKTMLPDTVIEDDSDDSDYEE